MSETVRVVRDGAVATLTLDRPEGRNSFDVATAEALFAAVRGLVHDADVRAVVVTGSGRYFCTGGDVAEMGRNADTAHELFDRLTHPFHAALAMMQRSDTVFVTAMNGIAAGGGVGLALAGDLVVAAEGARFVVAYANLGVSPDGGATAHLVRALGPHRAREAILIDDGISAAQAQAWGLVNRVTDPDALLETARGLAETAAGRARHTVLETKRLVEAAWTTPFEALLEAERQAIMAAGRSADFREGIRAFHEKRPPRFA